MEKTPRPENPGNHRNDKIRQRAISDAMDYVLLAQKHAPEYLVPEKNGELVFNAVLAEQIMHKAKTELGMASHEMSGYLGQLYDTLTQLAKSGSKIQ